MNFKHSRSIRIINQQGMTLIVGLVMMLLLTIVGLASIRGSGLQERMAFNMRDRNIAFQAAESALRVCESDVSISKKVLEVVPTCLDKQGMCRDLNLTPAATATIGGDYFVKKAKDTLLGLDGVASQPICLIEELDIDASSYAAATGGAVEIGAEVPPIRPYRVTAQAAGAEQTTQVLIQSIYARRF